MAVSLVSMATPRSTPETKARRNPPLSIAAIRASKDRRKNVSIRPSMLIATVDPTLKASRLTSAAAIRPATGLEIRLTRKYARRGLRSEIRRKAHTSASVSRPNRRMRAPMRAGRPGPWPPLYSEMVSRFSSAPPETSCEPASR